MSEKSLLAVILTLFVLLGISYAVVTPVFEASDELWHYPMVRHLADGNPLPVQVFDPAEAGLWKQEASQPPLYYYLGAALTFWIDTSDMEAVRWLNPHVDNGVITADGNTNLVVHDPQASPWQGTLLAVRIVRIASVFLGAVTVYLTYRLAKLVAPERPEIALGAAALNAFTPMFLFISGAVNNDNLAIPLASLALFLMALWISERSWSRRRWVLLGVVIGLAVLTKEGTLGLLPLAWGTIFVAQWQANGPGWQWRDVPRWLLGSLRDFAFLLAPVLLIAGWWYARNIMLYGDLLGWNAFIAVLGQRAQPATLAQLWDERWGFLASYWGLFGGVNIPMLEWIYQVLNGVLLVAVAGFFLYLLRLLWREQRIWKEVDDWRRALLELVVRQFPLLVTVLFAGAVVYGLINWATTTWSSQGRLVFTAISALSTLLVLGLAGWLPSRWAIVVLSLLGLFLLLVAAAAPFAWIRPAYQPPAVALADGMQEVDAVYGERMRLEGYRVEPLDGSLPVEPGDELEVTLVWEALAPMERDWSVFVHLNDPVLATPLAQRDMYPGQGLLATRLLRPGERLVDRYRLHIPDTAIAPSALEVVAGLYDFYSNERLPASEGRDAVVLQELALEPVPGEYPNAVTYNFGDELELVGYAVEPRRVQPGASLSLTLYWRALRDLEKDYTFFAQVLDEDTTRWAAADVSGVSGGTESWTVGDVKEISVPLSLDANTPPDVYPIVVGAYTRTAEGGYNNLQIVVDGRITMDKYLALTKVRVEGGIEAQTREDRVKVVSW